MPDIGVPELLIILVIVLLLFGGSRLTEVMRSLGAGVREFRKASTEDQPKKEEPKKDETTKPS